MNSIQKGSVTVVVSTAIASAAILMTGNSVADGNEIQKESVETPVKNDINMSLDASKKDSSVSLYATATPPPPSGPYLGDGSQLVSDAKKASASSNTLVSPELFPSTKASVTQKPVEEPKAPNQPGEPLKPVAASAAKASEVISKLGAPAVSEKIEMKAVQPVNSMANTAKKAVRPVAPKKPDTPDVKTLEKPQKVVIEPSKPEKTINSFKPIPSEMEMTGKQAAKQLDAPKLEKAVSAPNISSQNPKLQDSVISKLQPQTEKPLAPVEVQKVPVMPEPTINVQRPMQPQNMNHQRPVMPGNMGNLMMPRQYYIPQRNQQANSRPPLWQEKMWQQNNFQHHPNSSAYNTKQRGTPQGGQNRIMPPKGIYQYAPMPPSNYGFPQMPMWNGYNNGYYYQVMPYYWPVMPKKMPEGMPNTNMQKQGETPSVNTQNSIEGSSIHWKK